MKQNITDSHLQAYADLFIAKFDSISGDWRKPWLKTFPMSSQNAAGHLYSGVNDMNLTLICALKGYEVPVWVTSGQCSALGVMRLQGEQGTSVFWGGTNFINKMTGKTDSSILWSDYQKMSASEKEKYELRESRCQQSYVWNLQQTDFPQKYPDTWANLRAEFAGKAAEYDERTLDAFLQSEAWEIDGKRCPIILTDDGVAQFNRSICCIELPAKELFNDPKEFYNTLLHMMAYSAIITQQTPDDDQKSPFDLVAEVNLASELAAALIAGRLGMSSTLSESNLQYLKEWSRILSEDPSVIRKVVRKSRTAVQKISQALSLSSDEPSELCAALKEQIEKSRENTTKRAPAQRRIYAGRNGRTGMPCLQKRALAAE